MTAWVANLAKAPAFHFLLVGLVAVGLAPGKRPVIEVSDPGQIDDEVLIEEARRLGMLGDPVVSQRLSTLGAFLADHQCDDEAEAAAVARELALDRKDVVIRRYLVQMMKLALAAESDEVQPTEAELEAHLRAHADRFRAPEELELVHVFISARNGDRMLGRAQELRAALPDLTDGSQSVRGLGDPFARPNRLTASKDEITRAFGESFSEGLDTDQPQKWQGPLRSAHGVHWVWIDKRIPARMPTVAQVRTRLVHHYQRVKRQEHLEKRLVGLRSRYEIVVLANEG